MFHLHFDLTLQRILIERYTAAFLVVPGEAIARLGHYRPRSSMCADRNWMLDPRQHLKPD